MVNINPTNIINNKNVLFQRCAQCNTNKPIDDFLQTKSILRPTGRIEICYSCLLNLLHDRNFSWESIDKICQSLDIPFVPNEWERIFKDNGSDALLIYSQMFFSEQYSNLSWKEYYEEFLELEELNLIKSELPQISEELDNQQKKRWGLNYDKESREYLDNLYTGMSKTQNINGALQTDQALKLCKISLEIENRIREGSDFDKLLGSYEKLTKIADFTPKNTKNYSDFESVGELAAWLEKRGWINKYFDGESKDIVDETIKNIQTYNRRIYTNEPGMGEEIEKRINGLEKIDNMENNFGSETDYDIDTYDIIQEDEEEETFEFDLDNI